MRVDRRKFLRGTGGAVLALPLLDATAEVAGQVPKRIAASGVFFGMMPAYFHPKEVGRDYRLPKLLQPFSDLRNDFTVFSGLDHNIGGGHEATKYFLTGVPLAHAKGFAEGNVSVDQKQRFMSGARHDIPR